MNGMVPTMVAAGAMQPQLRRDVHLDDASTALVLPLREDCDDEEGCGMMTTVERLERGLERIRQGWIPGKTRVRVEGHDSYCALGALVSYEDDDGFDEVAMTYTRFREDPELMAAVDALAIQVPDGASRDPVHRVYRYNDEHRTLTRSAPFAIQRLFERAIAAERAKVAVCAEESELATSGD